MASGFCYIVTNRHQGVLYVGVTRNLSRHTYHWPRAWKVNLIEAVNPDWVDLYLQLAGKGCPGRARA